VNCEVQTCSEIFIRVMLLMVLVFAGTSCDDLASELSEFLCEGLQSVAIFHPVQNMHISLSKTFVMRHHWIEPMVADLGRKVALCNR